MPKKEEAYQKIREESRSKIIDSAITVFSQKGFSKTNISDIAEAANISTGLMYRYFRSKQELFDTIIDIAISGIQEIVQILIFPDNPKKKMEQFCQIIIDNMNEESYINLNLMIIQCLLSKDTSIYQKILAENKKMFEAVEQLIKLGQKENVFVSGDTNTLATLLFSIIQGLVLMKAAFVDYFKMPNVNEMIEFLIKK